MRAHYDTFLQLYDCGPENFVGRSFGRKWIVMLVARLFTLVWYQSVISLEVVGTFLRQRGERVSIMQMPSSKLRYSFRADQVIKPIKWRTEGTLLVAPAMLPARYRGKIRYLSLH